MSGATRRSTAATTSSAWATAATGYAARARGLAATGYAARRGRPAVPVSAGRMNAAEASPAKRVKLVAVASAARLAKHVAVITAVPAGQGAATRRRTCAVQTVRPSGRMGQHSSRSAALPVMSAARRGIPAAADSGVARSTTAAPTGPVALRSATSVSTVGPWTRQMRRST